jgi:hypothetical protein
MIRAGEAGGGYRLKEELSGFLISWQGSDS